MIDSNFTEIFLPILKEVRSRETLLRAEVGREMKTDAVRGSTPERLRVCYTLRMAEPKTKPTAQSPEAFLKTIEPERKRNDGLELLELFEEATGEKAVMWGTSIVGFGSYEITKGKRVDHWPLVAFSLRKQNLTLYVLTKDGTQDALLKRLGKHTVSGSCLHINTLADVDRTVLVTLIRECFHSEKAAKC